MKRMAFFLLLAAAPLVSAAIWMDDQPSHRAHEAPVLAPPAAAVPITGMETVPEGDVRNPLPATPASVSLGRVLYTINCAMCHGDFVRRGPVGMRLNPPPPGLPPPLLQALSDTVLYKAITSGFGRMPPFQGKLTIQDRWHLVNYLRSLK